MNLKTGLIIGLVLILGIFGTTYVVMNININDEANVRLQDIDGSFSKVEVTLDNMNKTISQEIQVTKGEKDAFLEFQSLVADSKKGQSLGGIMTQVNEKYPNFEIKGFDRVARIIEVKRNEFATEQNSYNSKVVAYNQFIVKKVNKFFLDPGHVKKDQFVVSSKAAKKSMETGIDEVEEISFE